MRDFFSSVWKIAAGFAAGAFVLSLLIGLIAGNPFGIALSRAFLLALVFAALGAGLRGVVKAYLPELTAGAAAAAGTPPSADLPGRRGAVDIVVPDDESLRRQAYQQAPPGDGPGGGQAPSGAEPEEARAEPGEGTEMEGGEPDASGLGSAVLEPAASNTLSEDLAEDLPFAEGGQNATYGGGQNATYGGGAREAGSGASEELSGAEAPATAASADRISSGAPAEDLDALPDIADLEPAAPPVARRPSPRMPSRVPRPRVGETPEDAMRNLLGGQDPATLARAIRTSLKKDEKG